MLKTLNTELAKPRKGVVGFGGGGRAGRDIGKLDKSRIDNVEVDGGKVRNNEVRKKSQKETSKNLSKSKKIVELDFLTLRARLAFTKIRQAFVKFPIFHYFDLEYHIRVKIDATSYAIGRLFNQLTLDDLGQ